MLNLSFLQTFLLLDLVYSTGPITPIRIQPSPSNTVAESSWWRLGEAGQRFSRNFCLLIPQPFTTTSPSLVTGSTDWGARTKPCWQLTWWRLFSIAPTSHTLVRFATILQISTNQCHCDLCRLCHSCGSSVGKFVLNRGLSKRCNWANVRSIPGSRIGVWEKIPPDVKTLDGSSYYIRSKMGHFSQL